MVSAPRSREQTSHEATASHEATRRRGDEATRRRACTLVGRELRCSRDTGRSLDGVTNFGRPGYEFILVVSSYFRDFGGPSTIFFFERGRVMSCHVSEASHPERQMSRHVFDTGLTKNQANVEKIVATSRPRAIAAPSGLAPPGPASCLGVLPCPWRP